MEESPRPGTYLQIGEAADRVQLTQRTLRFYEEKGLLKSPDRMEGGFRLYSPDDVERLERIKQFKDLLGFSLAEIKEMLDADDVREQIRTEWRKEADASEKIEKIRKSREMTVFQLHLIEQKMEKMKSMREVLKERLERYDHLEKQWTERIEAEAEADPVAQH